VAKKKSRLPHQHQHQLLRRLPLHLLHQHLTLLLPLLLLLLLPLLPLRHLLPLPASKLRCTKEKATFGWLFLWALAAHGLQAPGPVDLRPPASLFRAAGPRRQWRYASNLGHRPMRLVPVQVGCYAR
jgi:hypothetical protein